MSLLEHKYDYCVSQAILNMSDSIMHFVRRWIKLQRVRHLQVKVLIKGGRFVAEQPGSATASYILRTHADHNGIKPRSPTYPQHDLCPLIRRPFQISSAHSRQRPLSPRDHPLCSHAEKITWAPAQWKLSSVRALTGLVTKLVSRPSQRRPQ